MSDKKITLERSNPAGTNFQWEYRDSQKQAATIVKNKELYHADYIITSCKPTPDAEPVTVKSKFDFVGFGMRNTVEALDKAITETRFKLDNSGYVVKNSFEEVRNSKETNYNKISFEYIDASPLDTFCKSPLVQALRSKGTIVK